MSGTTIIQSYSKGHDLATEHRLTSEITYLEHLLWMLNTGSTDPICKHTLSSISNRIDTLKNDLKFLTQEKGA